MLSSPPGQSIESKILDLDCLPLERTLGLVLNYDTDSFLLKTLVPPTGRTKREMLRIIASILDPLGFLAPVLLTAKVMMQDVCRKSVEWDEELDQETIERLTDWTRVLAHLRTLTIKHCIIPPECSANDIELHVFADASEVAYGAVSYLLSHVPLLWPSLVSHN